MTIVSLFRRYKRWNPVHPTYGAFWGIGLGFGCGVGWGPGFGPEVVGYVGSGCGVGISLGVTFVGIGVGLPASGLTCVPCNVVTGAGQRVQEFSTTWLAPTLGGIATQTWHLMSTQVSILDHQLQEGIQKSFKRRRLLELRKLLPEDKCIYEVPRGDGHEYNPRSQLKTVVTPPAGQNQGPKDASQNIPGPQF